MEYDTSKREVRLDRNLSELDKFVLSFCKLLDNHYVLVSGYVSILFGRSRATEDVDLLIEKMSYGDFFTLWEKIKNAGFECLNTSEPEEAYDQWNEFAIRFSRIGKPIPNMEFKMIKTPIDEYSFKNHLLVLFKEGTFRISPFEMQIAFKLKLGSDKDLEDAKHLYELFKEKINKEELGKLVRKFEVEEKFGKLI